MVIPLGQAQIPCGPINNFEQVFSMPTVKEREMLVTMKHPAIGELPLVGSPLKMSDTPIEYRLHPPLMGANTEIILNELLEYSPEYTLGLKKRGVVE
jgi:crotonobetainyl-CoA:carnitine CoA-transferase CaiB-like acyl-CoA transferase